MELIEEHLYKTPDGRKYVAGYLPGKGWGLRPNPTTVANLISCADYAARVRAAAAVVSDILWVEEATGQLRRLILCPRRSARYSASSPARRTLRHSRRRARSPPAGPSRISSTTARGRHDPVRGT
jgi:hypothetical protein